MLMMRVKVLIVFLVLILAACTSGGEGTGSNDALPVTREAAATAANGVVTAVQTEPTTPATEAAATPTPWDVPSVEPALTPTAAEGPPPLSGLRYMTGDGIWQMDGGGQPVLLTNQSGAVISPDGTQALYIEEEQIWLLDTATGESRNLTAASGRVHCCPQWWPATPGTIIFGSWPVENVGPSSGYLSAVQTDGSGYVILSEEQSNALPALSPDGRRIAFDQGGSAWIYDFESGTASQLAPAEYGLENVQRIAGPSWSPDGGRLAWTIAATNPDWRISIVVIDLTTNTAQQFHVYENIGRGGWFPGPAWHPGGEWLAFTTEDVDPERRGVWLINTLTGEELFLGPGMNPIWSPDGRWLAYEQYSSPDSSRLLPTLVEFGSWQQSSLPIPDGGQLVEWVLP
jgi:hypothetical protein